MTEAYTSGMRTRGEEPQGATSPIAVKQPDEGTMTLAAARQFIASVPWRWVKDPQAEPHQYVIRTWPKVDDRDAARFVRLIERQGYKAQYRPPYRPWSVLTNSYLAVGDGWIYWAIGQQLCRQRAGDRQHEPLPTQENLWGNER